MKKIFAVLMLVTLFLALVILPVMARAGSTLVMAAPWRAETTPPEMQISPELLVSLAGVVLSLAFSYIPGLRVKFAALEPDIKRLIMLGLIVLVAAAVFGLTCANVLVIGLLCTGEGLKAMVWYVVLAIIANQSVYQITPLPEEVKNARDGLIS